MGICASCLGSRRRDSYDEDDVSRLLFDDPNNLQYGSFSEHNMNSQADPLESQREVEALQRVVARTSNNLVDVFEIAPQESQRTQPALFSGQEARMARYQNILAKLSTETEATSADGGPGTVEWLLSEDDTVELQGNLPSIKDEAGGPLVGTFADITAART
ncbi:late endosomal/lysosomal adaptor and MAPK and MTOR activator-domain-containing protein [Annulohypoxylon truncatum]|uniref:late endosomal/lysosomal adaptor and MAPK and MTOR activator-domain-containing protein n=1 Tax=Annulohypoxylon truncatum TaxID=327061 RepID=UPI002008BC26|nr:late endosomal/lysosomal adaptor and MAPK and MTOR activator-domain-containing protein [Annulohypoxylon truncatum]KAI1204087.1 late endosomal/lysosomal adaptor and MAPK and MTOR activator-domain-containing protein [Annulohypoxylon truncatum]